MLEREAKKNDINEVTVIRFRTIYGYYRTYSNGVVQRENLVFILPHWDNDSGHLHDQGKERQGEK